MQKEAKTSTFQKEAKTSRPQRHHHHLLIQQCSLWETTICQRGWKVMTVTGCMTGGGMRSLTTVMIITWSNILDRVNF